MPGHFCVLDSCQNKGEKNSLASQGELSRYALPIPSLRGQNIYQWKRKELCCWGLDKYVLKSCSATMGVPLCIFFYRLMLEFLIVWRFRTHWLSKFLVEWCSRCFGVNFLFQSLPHIYTILTLQSYS